jgi:hypothetical protein
MAYPLTMSPRVHNLLTDADWETLFSLMIVRKSERTSGNSGPFATSDSATASLAKAFDSLSRGDSDALVTLSRSVVRDAVAAAISDALTSLLESELSERLGGVSDSDRESLAKAARMLADAKRDGLAAIIDKRKNTAAKSEA